MLPNQQCEDTPRATLASEIAPVDSARCRILIIEDNVDAADTLCELLELYGYEVAVAYSGSTGIERAKQAAPHIVLCDIGLPDVDGYAVARVLRSAPNLPDTRLVALSGYAQPGDVERAREAGFDDHVAKPPTLDRLAEVLSQRR